MEEMTLEELKNEYEKEKQRHSEAIRENKRLLGRLKEYEDKLESLRQENIGISGREREAYKATKEMKNMFTGRDE